MGVNAVIRRKDKKFIGSPADVVKWLSMSFPGSKFALTPRGTWDGSFERDGLAIEFYLDSVGPISEIRICMYGKIVKMYDYTKDWMELKVYMP